VPHEAIKVSVEITIQRSDGTLEFPGAISVLDQNDNDSADTKNN
jgi:hypothetical protein